MSPLYAWPCYRDPWDCQVSAVRFDGKDGESAIDEDHLHIAAFDRPWRCMQIALDAATSEPSPSGTENMTAHVLLSCAATQLRRSFPVAIADSGLSIQGTIMVPRTAIAGKATLTVELVGDHKGRRRVVGSSVPWSVIVEKAEAPARPGVPPLKTVWVDFSDADAPAEARRHAAAHAYVDVTATPPVLYLNKGIDGLQLLVLAENAKLERRRQRDMLGAEIARYVANTLFRTAVEQVTADEFGDRPEGPASPVLRNMCEAVAANLSSTETVDDLYDAVLKVRDGTIDGPAFWADVDLVLDRMTSVSSTIAQICAEVKHV